MLLVMVAFFLQTERGSVYSDRTAGNETLFTRGPGQLSWTAAREACGNVSSVILPGMRDTRALELLNVGEFAWIDGKEYAFCHSKNDANETKCRYVTARKEDTRENLTYICYSDGGYNAKDEMVPYADATKQCMKSKTSLLVVKHFVVPMIVPLNKTSWIGNYSDSSINSSLNPGQTVTSNCIGIMRLDHDKFEFGTTSCDENHTFICDASGFDTALTLKARDEMMPRLGDMQARKISNHPKDNNKDNDLIFILTGPTCGVLLVAIAIIILLYRKWKLNQNLPYLSKYRQKGCVVQPIYTQQNSHETSVPTTPQNPVPEMRRQDREMPRGDHFIELGMESKKKPLPFNNIKIKYNTQSQSNNRGNITADLAYHTNESSLASSQNPIDDNNSSDRHHLQRDALVAKQAALCGKAMSRGKEDYTIPKYQAETGQERERINVMYTDDEDEYINYRTIDVPSEY